MSLTPRGRAVLGQAAEARSALLADRLSRLDPHQRAAIAAAVRS